MMMLSWVETGLFWLAAVTAVCYFFGALDLAIGNRKMRSLSDFLPAPGEDLPRISVIIPARNEAVEIRQALTSVLGLDYPDLEIIVLDDRSEDETGRILDEMAGEYPQLNVVHIQELPPGWLGKNHALALGASHATGKWLLFTDADVLFAPDTLRRVMTLATQGPWDHLAGLPEIILRTPSLTAFICAFTIFFSMFSRPWDADNPRKKSWIGIGAFNLIRAEVYRAIGTHHAIAMRPDDDIKLGKLVKKHGYRQVAFIGAGFMRVAWYPHLGALIEGLMKNAFSGVDYRVSVIGFAVIAQFLLNVWPVLAVFFTDGAVWLMNLMVVGMMLWMCYDHARFYRMPGWVGFAFPWAALMMIYILIRATVTNLRDGGITWRGTFYPLDELRANDV